MVKFTILIMENGRKQSIQRDESRRSPKWWKQTIRDESIRSLVQSWRSFEPKQMIYGSKRSYLTYKCVKTDDLKGWKQRIHEICEITYPNPSLEVTLTLIWKLYGSSAFIRENNTEDRLLSSQRNDRIVWKSNDRIQ